MTTLKSEDIRHNVLLVNVGNTWNTPGLNPYDATRYSWPVSPERVRREAHYVLAVNHGVIEEVFEAQEWQEAKKENFPEIPDAHGNWEDQEWRPGCLRSGFSGRKAEDGVRNLYVGKNISQELRGQGVRYAGPIQRQSARAR